MEVGAETEDERSNQRRKCNQILKKINPIQQYCNYFTRYILGKKPVQGGNVFGY